MRAVCRAVMGVLFSAPALAGTGVWAGQAATLDTAPESKRSAMLWLDLHQRQTGGAFNAIVRPGIGAKVLPGLTVWAGYGWIPTVTETTTNEHRLW